MTLLSRSASPMGRLIDVEEVAGAVAYLASGDAATISGTTLVIDGAATA
jgi:NAD(P)-dependent dehydrogenase (short-subunit alcohol dehydrogenase family)